MPEPDLSTAVRLLHIPLRLLSRFEAAERKIMKTNLTRRYKLLRNSFANNFFSYIFSFVSFGFVENDHQKNSSSRCAVFNINYTPHSGSRVYVPSRLLFFLLRRRPWFYLLLFSLDTGIPSASLRTHICRFGMKFLSYFHHYLKWLRLFYDAAIKQSFRSSTWSNRVQDSGPDREKAFCCCRSEFLLRPMVRLALAILPENKHFVCCLRLQERKIIKGEERWGEESPKKTAKHEAKSIPGVQRHLRRLRPFHSLASDSASISSRVELGSLIKTWGMFRANIWLLDYKVMPKALALRMALRRDLRHL